MRCSPGLAGFHLYGADVCFNTMSIGLTCHVIDFHLSHLSPGHPESEDYRRCLARFEAEWNPRLGLAVADTSTWTPLRLSRSGLVRRCLQSRRLVERLRRRGATFQTWPPTPGQVLRFSADAAASAVGAGWDRLVGRVPLKRGAAVENAGAVEL